MWQQAALSSLPTGLAMKAGFAICTGQLTQCASATQPFQRDVLAAAGSCIMHKRRREADTTPKRAKCVNLHKPEECQRQLPTQT